jgi:ankyrin repeat protein
MDLINAIASHNEIKTLELLENPNIDCNHVDKFGSTALIWVCRWEMSSVILKLLEKPNIDIDYNHADSYGRTALMWACFNNMETVVMKLLDKQIDCNTIGISEKQWLDQMIVKYNDMSINKHIVIEI